MSNTEDLYRWYGKEISKKWENWKCGSHPSVERTSGDVEDIYNVTDCVVSVLSTNWLFFIKVLILLLESRFKTNA